MNYAEAVERLKKLDGGHPPVPSKPSKGPFEGFEGAPSPASTDFHVVEQATPQAPLPPLASASEARRQRVLALLDAASLWWRVSILEPGGRTVEVDTPSGYTLADWQAYAERYHGPGCAVTPIAGLPKPRAPTKLAEALRAACEGVEGITPAQFRALLSPEDVEDIAAGALHPKTLHAYALLFAEGMRSGRIAAKPAPSGAVAITEAEIEAARKGRLVVRQGTFSGAPEVKP